MLTGIPEIEDLLLKVLIRNEDPDERAFRDLNKLPAIYLSGMMQKDKKYSAHHIG